MHHLAAAAAVLAGLGRRARRRAGPAALGAARAPQHLDLLVGAGERFLQRHRQAHLDVRTARRGATAAAAAAAAEDVAEDVPERREDVVDVVEPAAESGGRAGVAEAVVARALLRIGQHLVRLRRLLELRLRHGVARIAVGVQLHRELAVGALELGRVDAAVDTQHFVVIPAL